MNEKKAKGASWQNDGVPIAFTEVIMGLVHKNVSQEMVAANRANAQKSTGPRTELGKRRSRLNAAKHLVCGRVFAPSMKELGEDPAEFAGLRESLRRTFEPQDAFEAMLVDDMAEIRWRRQRLMRAESGIVASHRTGLEMKRQLDSLSERGVEALGNPLHGTGSLASRSGSYHACREILRTLVGLKESVEAEGFQQGHRVYLERIYGHGVTDQGRCLISLFKACIDRPDGGKSPEREEVLREFMQRLESEIRDYKELAELYRTRDIDITQTMGDAQLLPSKEDLDRVIRYEASLERQFERKLQHLVAWRRAKGDGIRAPVAVQDSAGNGS